MNKNIMTLLLILVLVLIIVLASIFILRGKPADNDTPGDEPVVTAAPPRETETPAPIETTEEPIVPREPLVVPNPTPTPAPTPKPTPKPTPTPIPADAEGSFRSDTGTGLNLKVDWKTYKSNGAEKLQVDVNILSYSIFTSYQWKSITLKIGDQSWGADVAGFSYEGKDQISTKAATFTVDAPAPGTPITVEWWYGGSYSGKELDYITATGTVG